MRIVLFLLKCLVGVFATLGFLLVAGAAAKTPRGRSFWAAVMACSPLVTGSLV